MTTRNIALLALYNIAGVYGALWISDEFDYERGYFFAFFAIPLGVGFIAAHFMKLLPTRQSSLYRALLASQLIAFGWGNALLLNALGARAVALNEVSQVDAEKRHFIFARKQGVIGWLYRERW